MCFLPCNVGCLPPGLAEAYSAYDRYWLMLVGEHAPPMYRRRLAGSWKFTHIHSLDSNCMRLLQAPTLHLSDSAWPTARELQT